MLCATRSALAALQQGLPRLSPVNMLAVDGLDHRCKHMLSNVVKSWHAYQTPPNVQGPRWPNRLRLPTGSNRQTQKAWIPPKLTALVRAITLQVTHVTCAMTVTASSTVESFPLPSIPATASSTSLSSASCSCRSLAEPAARWRSATSAVRAVVCTGWSWGVGVLQHWVCVGCVRRSPRERHALHALPAERR